MDIESEDVKKGLKEGTHFITSVNMSFWFSGHEDYDNLCKTFISTIREAASVASSKNGSECESLWNDTDASRSNKSNIEVKAAKMFLIDQLARNCFRAEEEAFAYDVHAFKVARELGEMYININTDTGEDVPSDFLTGAYCFFIVVCLGHSEDILDHKLSLKVYNKVMEDSNVPGATWTMQLGKIVEHMAVIEKFGRYPHRNEALSRETTMEEKEWLSGPDVPDWARSQMK